MSKNPRKNTKKRSNHLIILFIIVSIIMFASLIVGIVSFPHTGEKSLFHYLFTGMFYIGVSFILAFLSWDSIKSWKRISKPNTKKQSFKNYAITILFTVFMLGSLIVGLSVTINSLLDLSSKRTKEVLIEKNTVNLQHNEKSSPSLILTGRDKDNNEYKFAIDKKEYDELNSMKKSGIVNDLKITYYIHTKAIKTLNRIN